MDNQNSTQLNEINKYMKKLDSRLSVPKYDPDRQSLEILRRSLSKQKYSNKSLKRNGSVSPRDQSLTVNGGQKSSAKNLQSYLDQGINTDSIMKLEKVMKS